MNSAPMNLKFWAQRGRQKVGPLPTREAALAEFRERFPCAPRKAAGGGMKIMSGYGEGGIWFDIRWAPAIAPDGEAAQ